MAIEVSGSPEEVLNAINQMSAVATYRKNLGWPLFVSDEEWKYTTEQDDRVCPICQGFGTRFDFIGPEVPVEFPDRRRIEATIFSPEVHLTYPDLKGECRCLIEWNEYLLILTLRLFAEMEEAIQ